MSAEHVAARTADIHANRILILDFGSQYTQLIARRVRELGVYCEIHPWDVGEEAVRAFGARGVILSGGPESVTQPGAPAAPADQAASSNRDRPVMTSGMTSGAVVMPVNSVRPLNRRKRESAKPASVPRMTAKVALIAAILSDSLAAVRRAISR